MHVFTISEGELLLACLYCAISNNTGSFLQMTVTAGEPVEVQLRVSAELLSVTSCRELIWGKATCRKRVKSLERETPSLISIEVNPGSSKPPRVMLYRSVYNYLLWYYSHLVLYIHCPSILQPMLSQTLQLIKSARCWHGNDTVVQNQPSPFEMESMHAAPV